jgi:hypothetical protein
MVCWSGSSPAGCLSIQVTATLSIMSGSLSLQSSHSMFGVLLIDLRSWYGYVHDYIIIKITVFTYF